MKQRPFRCQLSLKFGALLMVWMRLIAPDLTEAPVSRQVGPEPSPAATVEITGGVGFVPVTFARLPSPRELVLTMAKNGRETLVDQAVLGNDYWQTGYDPVRQTWSTTYNVPLDSLEDKPQPVEQRFRVIQPSP